MPTPLLHTRATPPSPNAVISFIYMISSGLHAGKVVAVQHNVEKREGRGPMLKYLMPDSELVDGLQASLKKVGGALNPGVLWMLVSTYHMPLSTCYYHSPVQLIAHFPGRPRAAGCAYVAWPAMYTTIRGISKRSELGKNAPMGLVDAYEILTLQGRRSVLAGTLGGRRTGGATRVDEERQPARTQGVRSRSSLPPPARPRLGPRARSRQLQVTVPPESFSACVPSATSTTAASGTPPASPPVSATGVATTFWRSAAGSPAAPSRAQPSAKAVQPAAKVGGRRRPRSSSTRKEKAAGPPPPQRRRRGEVASVPSAGTANSSDSERASPVSVLQMPTASDFRALAAMQARGSPPDSRGHAAVFDDDDNCSVDSWDAGVIAALSDNARMLAGPLG